MTAISESSSFDTMNSLAYPRTGKRGVPQQFPRRLFEMLEIETKLIATDANHLKIIKWSDSGKAFRILDIALFSSHILPKYFRTSKFSSFQRNLNLYGFSKVRRGPDTDMYAHPSFVRGQDDTLSDLRKCNSSAARKRLADALEPSSRPLKVVLPEQTEYSQVSRAVSPSQSPPRKKPQPPSCSAILTLAPNTSSHYLLPNVWSQMTHIVPVIHTTVPPATKIPLLPALPAKIDSAGNGRLDLLAMALSSMAEREARVQSAVSALQTAEAIA